LLKIQNLAPASVELGLVRDSGEEVFVRRGKDSASTSRLGLQAQNAENHPSAMFPQ
jgi:hypothetical protein